jgi:hypothetical protein
MGEYVQRVALDAVKDIVSPVYSEIMLRRGENRTPQKKDLGENHGNFLPTIDSKNL